MIFSLFTTQELSTDILPSDGCVMVKLPSDQTTILCCNCTVIKITMFEQLVHDY